VVSADFKPAYARALTALQRGRGAEAVQCLSQTLRSTSLSRDDELAIRSALAEAWLLQDDVEQASAALGRPPDLLRERIEPARLSALWRLHGRIAFARAEQSRAIALLGRALKQAELAHDSCAIGLAHYELGLCYKQVGEITIVREHINGAASALHAAGERRYLALVHSLSGTVLAQSGRYEEAAGAYRQAEHLATLAQADDVLALICGNQANVALMRHSLEPALALAERSVALHESSGSSHGLAIALATLGQICVRQGNLELAEHLLHRALSVRSPLQFHETTGAVFDSLAQIHLVRGAWDAAEEYLRQAADAYGGFGQEASRWYEWSVRLLSARLAVRRGNVEEGMRLADEIAHMAGAPPADVLQADLIVTEALLALDHETQAEERLGQAESRLDARLTPGAWGEYLRLRADLHRRAGRPNDAYHALAQSVSVFQMLGEGFQTGLSHLALAKLLGRQGARSMAAHHAREAIVIFDGLGAKPYLQEAHGVIAALPSAGTGEYMGSPADADDVMVRRLVDAAVMPELLALEAADALLQASGGECAIVFAQAPTGTVRILAHAGLDADRAAAIAQAALNREPHGGRAVVLEPLGRETDGITYAAIASARPVGQGVARRLRMIAAVAAQGFHLCSARDRSAPAPDITAERPLESLLPGFVTVSGPMMRVVEQVQHLQGNDLTVLITGESGTGKELIARAIHLGSSRANGLFLPYNCTTTTRDLADSQLFGHRRGSFTGAVADQPGLIRSAEGGTLFLDEIGDLPLEVQPKLLRFLEQGEVMPVGESRPQRVDVRVIAVTNADLEQRVAEGRFREDLYYRLSVIRIHMPPLRERRDAIPHLCALFLRETSERLAKADVRLGSDTLELFSQYWWPGNVRQLRNEIQRAVAMSSPGGVIGPEHLSADLVATHTAASPAGGASGARVTPGHLGAAVEKLEREMIRSALDRTDGNISETARLLGLTRRGLYLKLHRLGFETSGS
jgi:hydrogenase-4 transcriptional activator